MKKLSVLLLIMILVIGGCTSKESTSEKIEQEARDQATEEAIEAISEELGDDVDVETKDGTTTIKTENGGELVVASGLESGVPVPDDYPRDILPIYSEEYIALATNTEGSFSLSGYTNDSMENVIKFYDDAVKDGTVLMKEVDEEYYMNMGDLKGQTYSISIIPGEEDTGYKTNFTLVVMPSMGALPGMEATDEKDSGDNSTDKKEAGVEAPLVIPDTIEWPDDYPDKELPIYPTGATEVDVVENDGESTMVGLKTEDEVEVVYDYYKELLGEAPDFSEMNMAPMIMLDGTIEGQEFSVTVIENGEFTSIDLKFKTLIQIVYY